MFKIRRYTFRDNLISFLIGTVIGLVLIFFMLNSRPNTVESKPIEIEWEPIPVEAMTLEKSDPIELEVHEMTPEEIAEEEYYDSLELLACCVMAEAGNQDLLGKRMVVDVVLNRVDDPDFPDTITGVITRPGQFTTWSNGMIESVDPTEECFTAVRMELEERSYPSLIYFTAGDYNPSGTPWKKVGDHYFSTK